MSNSGEWIFCWNTLFSYKHQADWVQLQLCLIWNLIFSKSTQPTLCMLEMLFRTSLFFCYIYIWILVLLRSFRFWDIENVKRKFEPRYYAYKLYMLIQKRMYEMWRKIIDYCENEFLRHFYRIYFQICPRRRIDARKWYLKC